MTNARLAADIGGTFTDIAVEHAGDGDRGTGGQLHRDVLWRVHDQRCGDHALESLRQLDGLAGQPGQKSDGVFGLGQVDRDSESVRPQLECDRFGAIGADSEGEVEAALGVLEAGLARHPRSIPGRVVLGRMLLATGRADQAREVLGEVLSVDGHTETLRTVFPDEVRVRGVDF